MQRMNGKHGVVTGAGSGLGRAVALLFAAEGASVIVADINAGAAESVAEEVRAAGGRALADACDVSREDDVRAVIARSQAELGALDFMINNAGVQVEKPLHETTAEEYDRVFDVNSRGVFFGCKHAVLAMRAQGGGAIVNTASGLSLAADPILPVYTASKHAILGFTRAVGIGYAAEGIRCNCVCPGDMETPMVRAYWQASGDPDKARAEMEAVYPAGKIGQPEEVAAAILFLASDEASYVNASFLQIDGGLLSKIF